MIFPELEINPNIYYTKEEAAAMLRVSSSAINRLLRTGCAKGVKVGRQWRILGSELLQMPEKYLPPDSSLSKSMKLLSAPAFAQAWDNDEDAVYDVL